MEYATTPKLDKLIDVNALASMVEDLRDWNECSDWRLTITCANVPADAKDRTAPAVRAMVETRDTPGYGDDGEWQEMAAATAMAETVYDFTGKPKLMTQADVKDSERVAMYPAIETPASERLTALHVAYLVEMAAHNCALRLLWQVTNLWSTDPRITEAFEAAEWERVRQNG